MFMKKISGLKGFLLTYFIVKGSVAKSTLPTKIICRYVLPLLMHA